MIYGMEQGRTEKAILQQCIRDNRPVPDAIANAPELDTGSEFYLHAFSELNTCRYQDGPIPWTAIIQFCEVHDLDVELRDELIDVVREVDANISIYRADKAESKNKPKTGKKK